MQNLSQRYNLDNKPTFTIHHKGRGFQTQRSYQTPSINMKTITKRRYQAETPVHNSETESIFTTTNQHFFSRQNPQFQELKLRKFEKVIDDAISQDLENQKSQYQSQYPKLNYLRKSLNQTSDAESKYSEAFQEVEHEFLMQSFMDQFQHIDPESLRKIIEQNTDYFLHLFRICKCHRCNCGNCMCDWIQKGSNKLNFKGNYLSLYKKDFNKQQKTNHLMHAPRNEDSVWFGTQCNFSTTYSGDFKKLKNLDKDPQQLLQKPSQPMLIKTSDYKKQFINYKSSEVDAPKNIDMLIRTNTFKLANNSEYRDSINKVKKNVDQSGLTQIQYNYPFGTFGQVNKETVYKNTFLNTPRTEHLKNVPLKGNLQTLPQFRKSLMTQHQKHYLDPMKVDCLGENKKVKQMEKQYLLEKFSQIQQNKN